MTASPPRLIPNIAVDPLVAQHPGRGRVHEAAVARAEQHLDEAPPDKPPSRLLRTWSIQHVAAPSGLRQQRATPKTR